MSLAFKRVATETASVKRPPAVSGGQRGKPEFVLVNLKCTPLYPVDLDVAARIVSDLTVTLLETFIETNSTILRGDLLVMNGKEYPVKSIEPWTWRGTKRLRVRVEDIATPGG